MSIAQEMARRVFECTPAYRRFLQERGVASLEGMTFEALPFMDKKSYIQAYPLEERVLGGSVTEQVDLVRSAGTRSKPTYWFLHRQEAEVEQAVLQRALTAHFDLTRPTLAVVGLALGSWMGGARIGYLLRHIAMSSGLTLTVFSPGNQHEEIVEVLDRLKHLFDQIILFFTPTSVPFLLNRLAASGILDQLPPLHFGVLGEYFTELFRKNLLARLGGRGKVVSGYGAADLGFVGIETPATLLLRSHWEKAGSLLEKLDPELAPVIIPYNPHSCWIEEVDFEGSSELVFTKVQGVPLVRYRIGDRGCLIHRQQMAEVLRAAGMELPAIEVYLGQFPFHLGVYGRAGDAVTLSGTKITAECLRECFDAILPHQEYTGRFTAWTVADETHPHICIVLECFEDHPNEAVHANLQQAILKKLGDLNNEFASDYAYIYSKTNDPLAVLRVMRVGRGRLPAQGRMKVQWVQQ